MTTKLVYVASPDTDPVWMRHGYSGALKIADDRNPDVKESLGAVPGPHYIAGWGVHNPGADHDMVFKAVAEEQTRLGLMSYGLDLEFGWEYRTDIYGYTPLNAPEWQRMVDNAMTLFTAAKKHLRVPLWVTCLGLGKLYPYRLWYELGATFISPQLYGERGPLPDPHGSWVVYNEILAGQFLVPPHPQTPRPVPQWAWELRDWHNGGKKGARPKLAPRKVPEWFWQWERWKNALARRRVILSSGIPSLWAGQFNPRVDGSCIRFDAEIMTEDDYV